MTTLNSSKLFFVVFATAILLLAACAEEIQQEKTERMVPLNLEVIPQAAITRTSTDVQSTLFDANEDINAYFTVTVDGAASALISEKNNTLSTVSNPVVLKTAAANNGVNALSPKDGSTLYFPPGDNDKVDVSLYALYPSTVTTSLTSFAVQTSQTTDAAYKASDLMYASATSPKTDQTINLQFDHKMAKLIINASGEESLTMKKITLKSLYTSIDWDAATGVLGSTSGSTSDIEIASNGSFASSLTGVALFPPQTKSDTYFMEVTCQDPTDNNTEKTAYFQICTKEFEAGKVYTINVKIGPKNLKADGIVLIEPWPSTVGVINIEAVGNLGLAITNLADDGVTTTNTMQGSGLSGYYTYNGKVCNPIPTVTDGKETNPTTLVAETDYEVKYYNNLNAGTALVVVTGKGDYAGLSTFTTFNINKAANTMSYPNSNGDFTSNLSKNAIVQNALVKPSMQTNEVYGQMTYGLYSDAACTTAYTVGNGETPVATIDANGNVFMGKKGTVYVKASMDNTGNFEAASCSYKLTITAGDVSQVISVVWTDGKADGQETWPFTGTAITPAFTITDNGNTLVGATTNGTDYNYSFSNNVNVGTNTAVLTITGRGEYSGTKTFYFSITKVNNSWITLNEPQVPIDCGATASNPQGTNTMSLSLPAGTFAIAGVPKFGTGTNYAGTAANVTYSSQNNSVCTVSSTGVITGVGAGSTIVTATVAGTTNYNALTKSISVTVEKMSYIFVYNGSTSGTGPYYQNSGSSAQAFSKKFSANATLYAAVVGAGGGSDQSGAARGGGGGLVVASHGYNANETVSWYMFCGGGGQSCVGGTDDGTEKSIGGWPGGARPGTTGSSGAGGGATAICTTNSTDNWDYTTNDSRILVAGAGGGSSYSTNGGYAGGTGATTGTMYDYGGTALKLWMGGRAGTANEVYDPEHVTSDGGSGGAGYYGGRGGLEASASDQVSSQGAHGGSNYIKDEDQTGGWAKIYSGTAGTENISGNNATYSNYTNDIFNITYNGHKKNDNSTGGTHTMWPGYILIKITY